MAATVNNHSLVGEALKLLATGLGPYVTGKLQNAVANGRYALSDADAVSEIAGDVAVTLRVMVTAWNDLFRDCLGQTERSLVSEIREIRNRWAHLEPFNDDDLDRALDSVGRLLTAVAAANEAERVNRAKHRLRRKRYGTPPPKAASTDTVPTDSATASMPEPPNAATLPPPAAPDTAPVATGGVKSSEGDVPLPAAGDDAPTLTPHTVAEDVADDAVNDYIRRGVDHRRQREFGRAIAEFDLAIDISPANADAWYHRALAWGHMGDHDRAIIDFSRAIALNPDYADAYNCRGYARFCLGEYGPAMDDFERAIGLNPDDALTQKHLELARRHWDGRTDDDTRQAARFTDLSSPASGHR